MSMKREMDMSMVMTFPFIRLQDVPSAHDETRNVVASRVVMSTAALALLLTFLQRVELPSPVNTLSSVVSRAADMCKFVADNMG